MRSWRELQEYGQENGWVLLSAKVIRAALHRFRDRFLARKIHASGLRLGCSPKFRGLRHLRIGRNFSAGDRLWIEAVIRFEGIQYDPAITIGNDVNVSDDVHISCTRKIEIGSGALIGSRVLITDHSHGSYTGNQASSPDLRPNLRPLTRDKVVTIGCNVWLGDGVVVLGGAEIGDGAVVGANAVVTGSIPARSIAVGMPARPIRQWNDITNRWEGLSGEMSEESSTIAHLQSEIDHRASGHRFKEAVR